VEPGRRGAQGLGLARVKAVNGKDWRWGLLDGGAQKAKKGNPCGTLRKRLKTEKRLSI